MAFKHDRPKPVIGLVGGIGAGKSAIAALCAKHQCAVIDSDALSHEILQSPPLKNHLATLFGPSIFSADSSVDRKALGRLVFSAPTKLANLNALIHPHVNRRRDELMAIHLADPHIHAIVWDTPLLLESALDRECDCIVYVGTPPEVRLDRLKSTRGWTPSDLAEREKLQFPLDKKALIADYCIDNGGDKAASEDQVLRVLSLFMKKSCTQPGLTRDSVT